MSNTLSEKQKWQKNLKDDEIKLITDPNLNPLEPEDHGWIHITLRDNKLNYKVKEARYIVLVGCGSYPYSLFDMARKYSYRSDLFFIGIDYDEKCYKICQALKKKHGLNNFLFMKGEGKNLDYSKLNHTDMVFLSADINDIEDTYWSIVRGSPAQVFICKPHKKSPGIYPGD